MSQTTLTQNARPVFILSTTHLSLMLLSHQLLEYLQPLTKTIPVISQRMQEISHVFLIQYLRNQLAPLIFLLFLPRRCHVIFMVIVVVVYLLLGSLRSLKTFKETLPPCRHCCGHSDKTSPPSFGTNASTDTEVPYPSLAKIKRNTLPNLHAILCDHGSIQSCLCF